MPSDSSFKAADALTDDLGRELALRVTFLNGSGKVFFDVTFTPGQTLETVVKSMSQNHPELHRALWDPDSGQLGASVELIINDVFMGIEHTMETPVSDGDRITLLPAWDGG